MSRFMVADYYAILGIDPSSDRPAIEAALDAQRRVWSSGTRNPKYKHAYQSYLDQVPEVRRILLGDPASRAAYDAELAAARRAERDRKLDELQRLVRLRSAKGGLTVSDRTLLRDRTRALGLEPADLDRLSDGIPPRPEAPVEDEPEEVVGPTLDPTMRRQIRSALEHVRCGNLYEALGVTRDAFSTEIKARADDLRDRWMRKSQVTAEKTAWLDVISYAQSHLLTPTDRGRYDRTLLLESEEEFTETVLFAVEAVRSLDSATRTHLIHDASRLGIDPERAERLVSRACKAKGVSLDPFASGTPAQPPPRTLRCRSCGGTNDFTTAAKAQEPECRHCRAPLRWTCPGCQRVNWVDEVRCRCKFRIENVEPLLRHFEAAQRSHKIRDYDRAQLHLERVLELAPAHAGARKGLGLIQSRLAEVAEVRSAFDRAAALRRLVEARTALNAWGKLVAPTDPSLNEAQERVNSALRLALELVTKARASETLNPRSAREDYRQALALVADLADAREGLLRCPPDPPTHLSASFDGAHVRLTWTPPPPDGLGAVGFVVIRKTGGVPTHGSDGQRLGQASTAEYVDERPPSGDVIGYAVYSVRGKVASTEGATSTPLRALSDVTDVQVESRSREVLMSWTLPAKAEGVAVYRREGGGAEIPVESSSKGLLDRNLEDEHTYRYRIVALYRLANGEMIESQGREIAASPHRPIEPMSAPNLAVEAGRVVLTWTPPPIGRVKVVRSVRPLPFAPGSTVTADRLAGETIEWLDASRPDAAVDPQPPGIGLCHYTPLTQGPEGLIVGHPVLFSTVPDPSDLRAVRVGVGGRVHLRWRWSPRATESVIVARPNAAPTGPGDPGAIVQSVLDAEYSRQGFAALTLPATPSGPWHLAVFTATGSDDERLISPGLDPSARTVVPGPNPEVTLSYTIRRQGFSGRSWTLTFRTDPPGSTVPPTVLVAHPRTVPLSPDDGESVEQFPAAADGTTFAIKPRLDLNSHRVRLFPDPTSDPDGLPPIRIRHPESAATRV